MVKMSYQDEKLEAISRARKKYNALMGVLRRGGNPAIPNELAIAIADYEKLGAVRNSYDFETALKRNWRQINIPSELKPKLERIAMEDGPRFFLEDERPYWERWKQELEQ